MASGESHDEDHDDVPLHHKKPFGSGLRRKPISFVPAESADPRSGEQSQPSRSIADLYLGIVLAENSSSTTPITEPPPLCEVCQMPVGEDDAKTTRHEASIAHQVCLTHSHPPSALDRSRMGLTVLQSQGWDPDARTGLGSDQQGVQYPIKVKEKNDTLGIGVQIPKEYTRKKEEKIQKLDAKKVRKMAAEDKKKTERLQRLFYGDDRLEKYLGTS